MPKVQELLNMTPESNAYDVTIISPFTLDVGIYIAKEVLKIPTIFYFPGKMRFICTFFFWKRSKRGV